MICGTERWITIECQLMSVTRSESMFEIRKTLDFPQISNCRWVFSTVVLKFQWNLWADSCWVEEDITFGSNANCNADVEYRLICTDWSLDVSDGCCYLCGWTAYGTRKTGSGGDLNCNTHTGLLRSAACNIGVCLGRQISEGLRERTECVPQLWNWENHS